MRLAATLFVLSVVGGCAPSTLAVSTDAHGASVFIDGKHAAAPTIGPAPSYGTVAVDVAPGESPRESSVRDPERHYVAIEPPAPEWVFPFDLPVEAVHRLFSGPDAYVVHASLPARSGVVDDVPPARIYDLGLRADRMKIAR